MLEHLDKKDFDKYSDFAYSLALNQKTSSYPTYTDGIKTKKDFILHAKRGINDKTHQILLFKYEKEITGWIHYYVLEKDKLIAFEAFNIQHHFEIAFDEFIKYIIPKYKGYKIHFGFPEINYSAISYLKKCEFDCIEKSYVNILKLKDYTTKEEDKNIVPVSKDNFDEFKKLHDNYDNMYWNSERLYDAIINPNKKHRWYIYLYYQNQKLTGNIYFICINDFMEIFGIDYADKKFNPVIFKNLTIKALNKAKEINVSHLYFFADKNEHCILQDLGFTHIGNYELYEKVL